MKYAQCHLLISYAYAFQVDDDDDELKDLLVKGENLLKRTTDPAKSAVSQKHNLLLDKYNTLKVQKENHMGCRR